MRNLLTLGASALLTTGLAWAAIDKTALQDRPPREDYNSGAYLYRVFCATCHGEDGRGDGLVADIADRRPSDLTVLTRNSGGTYPRHDVLKVLENLGPLAGHEPPTMPNWSRVLRTTEGDDERVIRRRLEALVDHIATLQQK